MKTFSKIYRFIIPHRHYLILSIICTVFYALFNGISVYLTIPLLETLFSGNKNLVGKSENAILPNFIKNIFNDFATWFNNFVFSGNTSQMLLKICILIIFAFFLKNLFGYMQSYFLAFVEQRFTRDLRDKAYEHLHKLPMSYFKNEQTGELISRITNDVKVVDSISAVFLNLIREPLSIIIFIAIAIMISWQLTMFALLVVPVSLFIIAYAGNLIRKMSRKLQEKIADITIILEETITGVKIVKAFGMEEYEIKKFKNETNDYSKILLRMAWTRNASSPLTEFLSVVVGAVIIYYGGSLVLEYKTLGASQFMGFLFAIFSLMTPVKELTTVNNRVQEASAAAERIFEIMEIDPTIKDIENPLEKKSFDYKIKFEGVTFNYSDSPEIILDNINFEIKKGEIIALVGSSGSGKTTLIDLLPRFFDPVKGIITIDDIDIRDIKLKDLRALLGIVTQETMLFNESVRDNIAYGLKDFPDKKIIEAAKIANAHNFICELPNGYDTVVGERATKLSGGQRQRISIARALLKNPPIMIFDEATSALDNESEKLVQDAIENLMKDRTTFVIAHRLSTIQNADKIIVLDKGKIVQTGSHTELINIENGLYKKLFDLQFRNI